MFFLLDCVDYFYKQLGILRNTFFNVNSRTIQLNPLSNFTFHNLSGESGGALKIYNASKKITTPPDSSPNFTYDALGNRIKKTASGTETRYVNDITEGLPYVLAELNSSNQPQSLNLYAGGLTSMGGTTATSRIYPLTDPTGNIRFLTDSTGKLIARYAYDPYGNMRKKEGAINSAFTFATEQSDSETGLTFLRARYYDPTTGTFLSRDPVLGPLGLPLSQNPYVYALSNPVNLNDPSGEIVPLLVGAYVAFELGMTVYDAYNTYQTLTDEGASCLEQAATSAGFVAGLALPGAGYGTVAKPMVTHKKLQNIVRDLYKGLNSNNPIGTGSTADAIRHTKKTGELVGGTDHLIKGQQSINALNKFVRGNYPDASSEDINTARILLNDLTDALNR